CGSLPRPPVRSSTQRKPGVNRHACMPAMSAARRSALAPLAAVELEAVMDDVVAELARDLLLELLAPAGLELEYGARVEADPMVVMLAVGRLEAGRAALEGVAVDGADTLQQLHRPVDGGERDAGIDGDGAVEDLHCVGMVAGLRQDRQDDPARPRD